MCSKRPHRRRVVVRRPRAPFSFRGGRFVAFVHDDVTEGMDNSCRGWATVVSGAGDYLQAQINIHVVLSFIFLGHFLKGTMSGRYTTIMSMVLTVNRIFNFWQSI